MKNLFKSGYRRLKYYSEMFGIYTAKGLIREINYDGAKFKVSVNSKMELYNRARDFAVEKVTMYWIEDIIKDGDVVFDIGANVGIYSLLIAAKNKNTTVYSFEPEAGNFYKLNKNISLNGFTNMIPYPIALSERTGIANFYVSSEEFGSATHSINEPFSDGLFFKPKRIQGISSFTLPELTRLLEPVFPNHIKIDVDGYETKIIEASRNVLTDSRLKSIMIEVSHNISKGTTERIITGSNFREVKRETWNYSNGDISNILFLKQN